MSKKSFDEFIASLKIKNFKLTLFDFIDYGKYSIEDADWNYKDVTHTEKVHEAVNQIQGAILNDVQTTVNLQKIPLPYDDWCWKTNTKHTPTKTTRTFA